MYQSRRKIATITIASIIIFSILLILSVMALIMVQGYNHQSTAMITTKNSITSVVNAGPKLEQKVDQRPVLIQKMRSKRSPRGGGRAGGGRGGGSGGGGGHGGKGRSLGPVGAAAAASPANRLRGNQVSRAKNQVSKDRLLIFSSFIIFCTFQWKPHLKGLSF